MVSAFLPDPVSRVRGLYSGCLPNLTSQAATAFQRRQIDLVQEMNRDLSRPAGAPGYRLEGVNQRQRPPRGGTAGWGAVPIQFQSLGKLQPTILFKTQCSKNRNPCWTPITTGPAGRASAGPTARWRATKRADVRFVDILPAPLGSSLKPASGS